MVTSYAIFSSIGFSLCGDFASENIVAFQKKKTKPFIRTSPLYPNLQKTAFEDWLGVSAIDSFNYTGK
jgi:hypothetical protein